MDNKKTQVFSIESPYESLKERISKENLLKELKSISSRQSKCILISLSIFTLCATGTIVGCIFTKGTPQILIGLFVGMISLTFLIFAIFLLKTVLYTSKICKRIERGDKIKILKATRFLNGKEEMIDKMKTGKLSVHFNSTSLKKCLGSDLSLREIQIAMISANIFQLQYTLYSRVYDRIIFDLKFVDDKLIALKMRINYEDCQNGKYQNTFEGKITTKNEFQSFAHSRVLKIAEKKIIEDFLEQISAIKEDFQNGKRIIEDEINEYQEIEQNITKFDEYEIDFNFYKNPVSSFLSNFVPDPLKLEIKIPRAISKGLEGFEAFNYINLKGIKEKS